jgi:hypothetical protein
MVINCLEGASVSPDDAMIRRTIQACEEAPGGGGMRIAVCNPARAVYLLVETASDTEFIETASCLIALGFEDISAFHEAGSEYQMVLGKK